MNGFDVAQIAAALPSRTARAAKASAMVADHLARHPGYVAWSGGRDSTAVVHLARQVDPNVPVVFFDSGLEFPETRAYLAHLADRWSLNFHVIAAQPDALSILVDSGVWEHGARLADGLDLHAALIDVPARTAHARFGVGELTGLRAEESAARRVLLASGHGRYTRKDGSEVCAPVWRWSSTDVRGYLAAHDIPDNPVYQKLVELGAPERNQRVGLAFDVNGLEYGRATWLRLGWPDLWEHLTAALPRLAEWR